jgi:hypothetical protein
VQEAASRLPGSLSHVPSAILFVSSAAAQQEEMMKVIVCKH